MTTDPFAFALETRFEDLPDRAVSDALRGLTDTLGVAIAARGTELSRIIHKHAAEHFAAGAGASAALWQNGARASPAGAALANAMTTDALDAHDGSKPTKGHVGCGVVAAALAMSEHCSGRELITRIAVGYEIGTRAGIALHATADDYHTSGAWIALACAAISARALGLGRAQTREALGIAEFHGPRSQMMRCIDHPTMVKDGSGWGAMAGVSAAYLAADGFTGAPAITIEAPEVAALWGDLGQRWYISEQYIKLYPVCRWAQPAVEAALALVRGAGLTAVDIEAVHVDTFTEAARLTAIPTTTEQAQYSLPFSVAASVIRGTIGPREVSAEGFEDASIIALARKVTASARPAFDAVFPGQRLAVVQIRLTGGRVLTSEVTEAQGDPENALGGDVIDAKFHANAAPVIGAARASALHAEIAALAERAETGALITMMAQP